MERHRDPHELAKKLQLGAASSEEQLLAVRAIVGLYAACPGGEGADLKSVGPKGLAGSNPVCSAKG